MDNASSPIETLATICQRHAPDDGANETLLDGVAIYRRNHATEPGNTVYTRCLFIVAQGHKRAMMGDETFVYDPEHYLVTSVPLPVVGQVLKASPEQPFFSICLDIRIEVIRRLVVQGGDVFTTMPPPEAQRGLAVSRITPRIKGATLRLLSLLDAPEDAPILADLCIQEILYDVLKGPQGDFLRALAMGTGRQHAIADLLGTIHRDCTREYRVAELASSVGMSETVFYEEFRAVTSSSPMQYIKRLRLLEAHRQLSTEFVNVSEAALNVGYNSISQFSREFKRVFGANPSTYLQSQPN